MKRGKNFTFEDLELLQFLYDRNIPIAHLAVYFKKNASTIFRVATKLKLKKKTIADFVKEFYKIKGNRND